MKKDLSAMGFHLLIGAAVGYASFLLGSPLYSLVLAVVAAFALRKISVKLFAVKEAGWWFANGGIIYIFAWLISWIILFNL